MNKLISIILLGAAFTSFAQEPITISPTLKAEAISFAQGVNASKDLIVGISPAYAPSLTINGKPKPLGGSIFGLYPINDYLFTGLRFDYLGGSFFSATTDVGLKADVQLFGHNFTPFTVGGVMSPLQGAGDSTLAVGAIVGAGIYTSVWHNESGKVSVDLAFEVEKNTLFPGVIYHPVIAINYHF